MIKRITYLEKLLTLEISTVAETTNQDCGRAYNQRQTVSPECLDKHCQSKHEVDRLQIGCLHLDVVAELQFRQHADGDHVGDGNHEPLQSVKQSVDDWRLVVKVVFQLHIIEFFVIPRCSCRPAGSAS